MRLSRLSFCLLAGSALVVSLLLASLVAQYQTTDYPSVYLAAVSVLDPDRTLVEVYATLPRDEIKLPEQLPPYFDFIYSVPAAIFLAPLGLLPYTVGKTLYVWLNVAAYLTAAWLALAALNVRGRGRFYGVSLALLWSPFLQNLRFAQNNGLLLLMVVAALVLAGRGRPLWGGALLGTAALFKIFPLAAGLLLAPRLPRFAAAAAVVFVLGIVAVPGGAEWLAAIRRIDPRGHTPPFEHFSGIWFWLYAASLAGAAAWRLGTCRERHPLRLGALALLTVFLIMPVLGTHHLTLAMLPFLLGATEPGRSQAWRWVFLLLASFLSLMLATSLAPGLFAFGSLVLSWFLYWLLLGPTGHQEPEPDLMEGSP